MRPEPVIQIRLPIKHACAGYARKFRSCAGNARLIKKRLGKSQVIGGRSWVAYAPASLRGQRCWLSDDMIVIARPSSTT